MTAVPTPATAPAFELVNVTHHRAGRQVLDAVDLRIPDQQITVLVGPSGAGKSSLLRLLNRLDDPTAGSVIHGGRPVRDYPVRALRRRVAFVFQTPVVFPGSIAQNLAVAAECSDSAEGVDPPRALKLAGLAADLATRDGAELSAGQQQRVNLARALVAQPAVLLLDEPTSALDPEAATHLLRTLRSLRTDHGLTIVMATHRLDEARRVADHVALLNEGRVVEAGPADTMWTQPEHEETRRFLTRAMEDLR